MLPVVLLDTSDGERALNLGTFMRTHGLIMDPHRATSSGTNQDHRAAAQRLARGMAALHAWVNGTFGVGKTTTAGQVVRQDPGLRLFDPEWVGYMVANNLSDHPVTDFQQHESWRLLTPVVADELIRVTGQDLVAVQTVMHEQYWDELETGLVARGHDVFHVVLEADVDEVRRRIDTDEVEVTAKAWRHGHLPVYARAREWLVDRADLIVSTSNLDPSEAASQILVAAGRHGNSHPPLPSAAQGRAAAAAPASDG